MLRGYGVRGWWWHKTSQNSKAQVAIVDTPGALQSRLTDYMKAADVIVIPTRTTSRDIEPLQRMQAAVKAAEGEDHLCAEWLEQVACIK